MTQIFVNRNVTDFHWNGFSIKRLIFELRVSLETYLFTFLHTLCVFKRFARKRPTDLYFDIFHILQKTHLEILQFLRKNPFKTIIERAVYAFYIEFLPNGIYRENELWVSQEVYLFTFLYTRYAFKLFAREQPTDLYFDISDTLQKTPLKIIQFRRKKIVKNNN